MKGTKQFIGVTDRFDSQYTIIIFTVLKKLVQSKSK